MSARSGIFHFTVPEYVEIKPKCLASTARQCHASACRFAFGFIYPSAIMLMLVSNFLFFLEEWAEITVQYKCSDAKIFTVLASRWKRRSAICFFNPLYSELVIKILPRGRQRPTKLKANYDSICRNNSGISCFLVIYHLFLQRAKGPNAATIRIYEQLDNIHRY